MALMFGAWLESLGPENERYTVVWWAALALVSLVNIVAYLVLVLPATSARANGGASTASYRSRMRWLAMPYVFGCALRATLPRIDVERTCMFDSWLSSTVVGRSVATVAELAFAAQLALAMAQLASETAALTVSRNTSSRVQSAPSSKTATVVRLLSLLVFVALCVAECASWLGVTTTNQWWHCIEESLWMGSALLLMLASVLLLVSLRGATASPSWRHSSGAVYLTRLLQLGFVYVLYMFYVDIPMYAERARQSTTPPLPFVAGVLDASHCHTVTRDFDAWYQDLIWMSGYFSVCVWISMWLAYAPTLNHSSILTSKNKNNNNNNKSQ